MANKDDDNDGSRDEETIRTASGETLDGQVVQLSEDEDDDPGLYQAADFSDDED